MIYVGELGGHLVAQVGELGGHLVVQVHQNSYASPSQRAEIPPFAYGPPSERSP